MTIKDMADLGSEVLPNKLDAIFQKRDYLRKAEPLALQYWKQPNWHNLMPVAICCDKNKDLLAVWNYYRYLISSEAQGGFPAGRSSFWLVVDQSSQAFLGLFGFTSFAQSWPFLENYLGWNHFPDLRLEHRKHIQFLARCLPSEPFGDLLGGKLLAMIATSQDILRTQELRYSLPVAAVAICTLHGQGSQYNRMENIDGPIQYIGEDNKGRGTYLAETRKNGIWFVKGDVPEAAEWSVPTLKERIIQWKERWYEKRLRHRREPEFESKLYSLGRYL